jgi:hypothetical protein
VQISDAGVLVKKIMVNYRSDKTVDGDDYDVYKLVARNRVQIKAK